MFPFSSLFTQVPLMILAAAYMLYFGAYAIGKSKENISENIPESREEILIPATTSFSTDTFYYNTVNEVDQDADLPEINISLFCWAFESDIFHDPDRFLSSHFNCFTLFSRPPPALG